MLLPIPPVGEFLLKDDWIFAFEVRALLEKGRYVHQVFTAPTVVAQTVWGAAFAKAFGLSYPVLRASTPVAAFNAVWAVPPVHASAGPSVRQGYRVIYEFPYYSYLGRNDLPLRRSPVLRMGERKVLVLEKEGPIPDPFLPPPPRGR